MVSKKEEDRRFQIELLKTEVDLENLMALMIGTIALEFAAFVYYGETGQVTFQLLMGIIGIVTIYFAFPYLYRHRSRQRFKDLEEQFIAKKKKES